MLGFGAPRATYALLRNLWASSWSISGITAMSASAASKASILSAAPLSSDAVFPAYRQLSCRNSTDLEPVDWINGEVSVFSVSLGIFYLSLVVKGLNDLLAIIHLSVMRVENPSRW